MNEIYHTADLWGVLRTICIILLVIHFLKIFARMLAPWLAKRFSKRMQKMAEDQMRQRGFTNSTDHRKPEGTVTVEKSSKSQKNVKKSTDGDYVDYEVID